MSSSSATPQFPQHSLWWWSLNRRFQTTSVSTLLYLYSFLLSNALTLRFVRAANVYVDDNDNSVSYSPSDSWQRGNGCGSCALLPNSGSTYDGTWHDTTYYPNGSGRTITFAFTGTDVSAYFIIPDKTQGTDSVDTSLTFTLDGSEVGAYTHTPSGSADFLYNSRTFSASGLSNGKHTLVVSAGATSDGGSTAVLFDYFVYTTLDASQTGTSTGGPSSSGTLSSSGSSGTTSPNSVSPSQSGSSDNSTSSSSGPDSESGSTSSNVGAIAGGVAGGTLGLVALLTLLLCWRRRRLQANSTYVSEDRISPTAVSGMSRGWMRKLVRLSDSEPSNLTPHPVVFADQRAPPSPGHGTEKRFLMNNAVNRDTETSGSYAFNENERLSPRRGVTETTEIYDPLAFPTASSPSNEQMSNNRVDQRANEVHPGTTAILSQVAELQAAVASLQEQRAREIADPVGIDIAPPEYSKMP